MQDNFWKSVGMVGVALLVVGIVIGWGMIPAAIHDYDHFNTLTGVQRESYWLYLKLVTPLVVGFVGLPLIGGAAMLIVGMQQLGRHEGDKQ